MRMAIAAVAVWWSTIANPALAADSRIVDVPQQTGPAPTPPPSPPLDQTVDKTGQQHSSSDNRGTDQVPLIVKELPRERSEEEKTEAKEKAALDRRLTEYTGNLASYTKALFIATLVLAALTGALAIAAFRQTRDARRAIAAAENAAKAAGENARATNETVIVLRNAQRPYLSPFNPELRNYQAAIAGDDASLTGIEVRLDITNVGPGIGFIKSYAVIHEICARDTQGKEEGSLKEKENADIGLLPSRPGDEWSHKGEEASYAFRVHNNDRDDIVKKRRVLYIYGYTRCFDLFHLNRRTGFIFECIPEFGILVMCHHRLWYDLEEEPETQPERSQTSHGAPSSPLGEAAT